MIKNAFQNNFGLKKITLTFLDKNFGLKKLVTKNFWNKNEGPKK